MLFGKKGKITEIKIQEYKNFKWLAVKDVSRINIITGPNGVGKSNLMDYIYTRTEKAFCPTDTSIHTKGIESDEEYKDKFIQLLQAIEPDITDIRDNSIIINDRHEIDLFMLGSGVFNLIAIANCLIKAKDGTLIYDVIENSLHHRMYPLVFKFIYDACFKYNVQLFCSTYSIEFIDAALSTLYTTYREDNESLHIERLYKEDKDPLTIIQMRKNNQGDIRAVGTRSIDAFRRRETFNFELR